MKLKNVFFSTALAAVCLLGLTGCDSGKPGNIGNEVTFKDGDKIAEINIEDYGTMKVKLFSDIAPVGVDNFIQLAESGYYDGLKIHRAAENMCIQGGSLNGDGTGGEAIVESSTNGSFPIEISPNARNFYGAVGYANVEGQNTTQFYIVNCKQEQDIKQYSPDTIREKAKEFTDKKEGMETTDPDYAYLTSMEAYYTNLADMIGKASDEVVEKYAASGGYPLWDGGYTVFGQVYEGLDVLDKISSTEVTTAANGELSKPVNDIIISSVTITEYKTPEPEPEESEESSSKNNKKIR